MNRLIQLTLFLLVVMLPVTAKAYDFEVNGIYYYTSGTNATVTYQYYSYEDSTDTYTSDYTGSVTIPETVTYNGTTYSVTSIGNSAFSGCSALTSVTIPNSVTSISGHAFYGCSALTSVNIFSIEAWLNISFGDNTANPLAYAQHLFLNGVEVKELVIPNSVTSIGDYAFEGCSGLTSVTIPNSVTSIGKGAFNACGFTSVTIPNSVTSVGDYAFYSCRGLTSVTIGNSVTSIGEWAFSFCSGLTSVTIPNSVTSIGEGAFYICRGLTSVTIGNSVTSIGERAFDSCSGLTSVTIPNSVTSIGDYAFRDCYGLTSVTIGNSVTSIGEWAFEFCSRLTSVNIFSIEAWLNISFGGYDANPLYYADHLFLNGVEVKELVIPNSVTSIGDYAFWGCSGLTSVTIPNSVTSIGSYAFRGCSALTSVTIPNSVTSIGDYAFQGCSTLNTLKFNAKSCADFTSTAKAGPFYGLNLSTINIGDSVQRIPAYFANGMTNLTSITIPNSVTSIGSYAFQGCSTLNTLKFNAKSCADFTSTWNAGPFYGLNLSTINIGDSVQRIPAYFANGMTNLTSITIPNSVTSVGDYAFSFCSGLTSVTIPNSVTSIGELAFYGCSGLTSVTIPNSVTSIGSSTFYGCSGLTSVNIFSIEAWLNISFGNYDANPLAYAHHLFLNGVEVKELVIPNSVTSIGELAFYGCSGLTSVTIPNSVTSIGSDAFHGCSGLASVTIGNSVTSIGDSAFYGCSGLTSVTIPNSVTSIGSSAFYGCSALTSVTIPNSVTSIGSSAFYGCSALTSVTIPNSVTSISERAFSFCSGLTSVTIPNSVTSIGSWAFSHCSGLTSVTIPNSVTSIGGSTFYGCSGLTSVTIPNSVTSIGGSTFYGCSGLASVTIPNSVTSIGRWAFYGCSGLTSVTIPNSVTSIGGWAFRNCSALTECYSYITNPSLVTMGSSVFAKDPSNYADRTLYVPSGSKEAYQANSSWYPYFGSIVEMVPNIPATSIELNQTAAEVIMGETMQLIATVLPDSTTNKVVTWSSSNPTIASVNENGLVTALAVGSATITAITTDGSNLSASCDVTVTEDLSNYDNYLSMEDTTVMHGETIVIPVKMTNEANIISFQTDIFLPEGLELLQEDGEYIIDPSERMTRTHSIMSNDVSNGAVRVICYSSNYKPFTGNSGDDLFYITVKVADDAEGDYTIVLRNTLLTNTSFVDLTAPDVASNVNVAAYVLGDANNSGMVTITDVVVTAQYVLEMNPQPFVFRAADVNFDGAITVADVSRIAWMVLNPDEANAPMRAPALWNNGDHMSGEGVSLMTGETRTVSIALDNEMDYTAFQMDLTLPEGLTASNFRLTDRAGSHAFDINTLANGKTRALCYSPAIEVIHGHDGALLTFDVTANAAIEGDIAVDGIELVTTACQTVHPDAFTIGVNAATSINEIAGSKTVARVEYFNVAGQRIDHPDSGVILVVTTYTDGTRSTTKVIR